MDMRIKILIAGLFALIIMVVNIVYAQEISLNLGKTIYYADEEIIVDVIIKNTAQKQLLALDLGISNEDDSFAFERIYEEVTLDASKDKKLSFRFSVPDFAPPGVYIIDAILLEGNDKKNIITQKIQISGTKKTFDFTAKISEDEKHTRRSNSFLPDEAIYMDYESAVSGVKVNAVLIFPDKTKRKISLPTSIKNKQVGTYELVVTASKEGYMPITKTRQFAVVSEKDPAIRSVSKCNINQVCDSNENYQTCPQDCKMPLGENLVEKARSSKTVWALIIIFLLVISLALYRMRRSKTLNVRKKE